MGITLICATLIAILCTSLVFAIGNGYPPEAPEPIAELPEVAYADDTPEEPVFDLPEVTGNDMSDMRVRIETTPLIFRDNWKDHKYNEWTLVRTLPYDEFMIWLNERMDEMVAGGGEWGSVQRDIGPYLVTDEGVREMIFGDIVSFLKDYRSTAFNVGGTIYSLRLQR